MNYLKVNFKFKINDKITLNVHRRHDASVGVQFLEFEKAKVKNIISLDYSDFAVLEEYFNFNRDNTCEFLTTGNNGKIKINYIDNVFDIAKYTLSGKVWVKLGRSLVINEECFSLIVNKLKPKTLEAKNFIINKLNKGILEVYKAIAEIYGLSKVRIPITKFINNELKFSALEKTILKRGKFTLIFEIKELDRFFSYIHKFLITDLINYVWAETNKNCSSK